MKKQNNPATEKSILRQKAEEMMKKWPLKTVSQLSEANLLKLIHELEVHQIELELQNEELRLVKEKAAELASEKYAELYNFAPSGYFTISKEGKIIELNLYGSQMLGQVRSLIVNSRFGFFVSDDTRPIFDQFLSKVFSSKAKETCEVILSNEGDKSMYVYLTGIADENGEQCFVTAVDITERKLAEEALRASEVRFKTIFNEAPLGIALIDSITGHIYSLNPMFSKIAGRTMDEMTHIDWMSITHPDDVQADLDNMALLNAGKISGFQMEKRYLQQNGIPIWINMTVAPIYVEDKTHPRHLCMIEDITERKQAEINLEEKNKYIEAQNEEYLQINHELVLQNEEKVKRTAELMIAKEHAEESDQLKSAFLANMNHEIRTPMNGILGFAELLKEPGLTGEQQQDYIRIIEKSGARMLNIINDIVDISKIESGQMKVFISTTNINKKIEYTHTFFKPLTEKKGIEFSFKNGLSANDAIIKTDLEKIYAILTNLVKNAIKYTDEGSIEFGYDLIETHGRASLTDPASLQLASYMQFYVKDTGIGIPQNRQQAIFDRFIQADITDIMARQGAGLGLSISKAYVEMLGGQIWVESEEGKGSTFYFTHPYSAEKQEETDYANVISVDEAMTLIKKLKILIVEDDEESEKLLELEVAKFSKKVFKAKTGFEAVEVCHNNPDLDLVLMDIRMPEMDGYEATQRIRQFNKDVVIIAQTAFALKGDSKKVIEVGCNNYISKPIKRDHLIAVMHKYFQN